MYCILQNTIIQMKSYNIVTV